MKLVFLDAKTVGQVPNFEELKEFGNIEIYQTTPAEKTIERIKGKDIVITNKVIIDKNTMQQAPDLKLICIAATGMNNVDLDFAKQKGIEVKNVSDYSTQSVAQVTFSLLLYLVNHTAYFDNYVKSGKYIQSDTFTHLGRSFEEIQGKRFGIIGLGTIGKRVAQIARAFGCEVVYFSTSGKNNDPNYKRLEWEQLLSSADIISIHAPLNENTENLFNYQVFEKMKKTAFLINTGRGKIVNEKDLAIALDNQEIAGAGLDVLEHEPINKDNPLLQIKNPERLIITPHIAWASIQARTLLIKKLTQNIKDFLSEY